MATQDRLPTSDNTSYNNWTALGGGSKYVEVDDAIGSPDDDTTYCSFTGSIGYTYQMHGYSAFTIPVGATVNKFSLTTRFKASVAGTNMIVTNSFLQASSTLRSGTAITETTSWATDTVDWLTNPATSAAWTVAEANGGTNGVAAFGYRTSLGNVARVAYCTQVYATFDYTEAASGGIAQPSVGGGVGRGIGGGIR